jgi:hypothetical protein
MGQLDKAVADQKVAMRELAGVLARAALASRDEPDYVADLLLRAGFPEESDEDTALLDAIDKDGAS